MARKKGFISFDAARSTIHVHDRSYTLPQGRWARIIIAILLILGGLLWFLPVVGFWMLPLGLLILSMEFHWVRRIRRRLVVWWENRNKNRTKKKQRD